MAKRQIGRSSRNALRRKTGPTRGGEKNPVARAAPGGPVRVGESLLSLEEHHRTKNGSEKKGIAHGRGGANGPSKVENGHDSRRPWAAGRRRSGAYGMSPGKTKFEIGRKRSFTLSSTISSRLANKGSCPNQ